jgi:hypothetical protein
VQSLRPCAAHCCARPSISELPAYVVKLQGPSPRFVHRKCPYVGRSLGFIPLRPRYANIKSS